MKTFAALIGVVLLALSSVSLAQTVPVLVKVYWTDQAATYWMPDGIPDSYSVTLDQDPPISVSPATVTDEHCPAETYPLGCVRATVTIATQGEHTICVVGVNLWGNSNPVCGPVSIP